jgi:anti-sigma regulatory factor (Ser/Thr protein kinase)
VERRPVRNASQQLLHEPPTLRFELPATPEILGAVRVALGTLDLSEDLLDDARLLTSELISNSIQHAGLGPCDVIEMIAVRSGSTLRVIVRDGGDGRLPDHVVSGSIRPSPSGRSGWGLYLVDKLAARWGTNVGGRRGFWFELEQTPSYRDR